MRLCDIEQLEHFWALMNNKLCVIFKDNNDDYYVAGGWECTIPEKDLTFIELIPKPTGYHNTTMYYDFYNVLRFPGKPLIHKNLV